MKMKMTNLQNNVFIWMYRNVLHSTPFSEKKDEEKLHQFSHVSQNASSDTQTEEELQNGGMEIISEREERTTAEKTKRRRNNTEKPGRRRDGEN
ncbi:hypothetical protein PO909_009792 [Leuciscus waleckii]